MENKRLRTNYYHLIAKPVIDSVTNIDENLQYIKKKVEKNARYC